MAAVEADSVVDLGGKAKFPRATVVYCGDRAGATTYIAERGAAGRAIVGGTATAGDSGTATAGHRGTATAGDDGTATAGDEGTATAGHRGTATAGDDGTATAGHRGILQARWWDGAANRWRIATGYVGDDGLEPDVPYRFRGGRWIKADA